MALEKGENVFFVARAAFGVIGILVPGGAIEHQSPELGVDHVAVALTGPAIRQNLLGHDLLQGTTPPRGACLP